MITYTTYLTYIIRPVSGISNMATQIISRKFGAQYKC